MQAAPRQPSIRRDRLISLDMGEVAQQLAQEKERARSEGGTPRAPGSGTAAASERLARCAASCRFACACCIGALHSMAPPTLSAAEAACMLTVYLAAVPNAFPTHSSHVHYTFSGSAEDVVALSLLRCAAVTLAHCLGTGPLFQRPYLLTAALFCTISLPLGLMKLVALVRHSQLARRQWPPFIALFALHMAFAVLHVLAAQRIVTWARKRWEHGLGGLGLPWQEGEDAWLLAGQLQGQAEEGLGGAAGPEQHDVPPDALAEPDSRWAQCGAVRVHYKLALPLGCRGPADTGLVLIHSFGGGTFAWRHIMQPLADSCGLPVLAFDRPGFGLTDRPAVASGAALNDNPYSLKFQALLTLQLASSSGFRRVVLAGHGDGAMLALMSAAMAAREAALGSPPRSPPPAGGSRHARGGRHPTAPLVAGLTTAPAAGHPVVHHRQQESGGSLPDSLDWAWMSSQPEGGPSSLLQRLLRGEWPASIEPRSGAGSGGGGGALLSGWASGRSPLRPLRSQGRRSAEFPQPQLLQRHEEEEAGTEEAEQREQEGVLPGEEGEVQLEEEHAERAQQAQQARQATSSSSGSGSTDAGGLPGFEGSLMQNPSFLSQPSTQASGGTEPADAPLHQQGSLIDNPSFLSRPSTQASAATEPAEAPLHQQSSAAEQASLQLNPSFVSQPQTTVSSGTDQTGGLLAHQSSLISNPSFLSQTSDREQWEYRQYGSQEGAAAAAARGPGQWQQQQQQQGQRANQASERDTSGGADPAVELQDNLPGLAGSSFDEAAAAGQAPAASSHLPPPSQQWPQQAAQQAQQQVPGQQVLAAAGTQHDGAAEEVEEAESAWRAPEPVGLVLLHPDLSGDVAPKYARVLAHSRLGRRVLRSLLRTEVGEVTNRRAWADPHRLTPELLALYRRPLSIEGWDLALTEVARVRNGIHSLERRQLLGAVVDAGLPVLVATGESDHITPPCAAARLAERLGAAGPRLAVLPACGHLSQEEAPQVLLDFLQSFLLEQGASRPLR
ncbi:hypothetical protein ABPG75_013239 [Micractinium tetrahymenae]